MYGDPQAVRSLADQARRWADALRDDATTTQVSALGMAWHSTAAEHFRGQVGEQVAGLRARAGDLDDLAAALLEHAARVEERLEQIAAAERLVRAAVEEAEHTLSRWGHAAVDAVVGAVTDLVDGARDVLDRVGDLPPPGSVGWLDAAARL